MSGQAEEWVTLASWLRALQGHVIEADAAMQVRQRLAWREFQRSLGNVLSVDLGEGIDRQRNLGVTEVRLHTTLEPLPMGIIARTIRAIRGWMGMPVPPRNAYRVPTSRAHAERWINVTLTVSREGEGAWQGAVVTEPPVPLETSHVSKSIG